MRKRLPLLLLVLPGLLFLSTYLPFPKSKLRPGAVISLRLEDRKGTLLREVLSDEGGRCRWVRLEDVSPHLLSATLAAEDNQFFFHRGVSPVSVLRALFQNARRGEVVSGASTITQQLVRNLSPGRRNVWTKLREAWLALRLERTVSKPEILTQYINRISYGNQTFGIEAASRLYLDKPSSQLSLAEAAFLAAIPRSPSLLNPYRAFHSVKKRQLDILARMQDLGFISGAERERAGAEDLCLPPASEKFRAPHFCDFVLSQIPPSDRDDLGVIETSLDYGFQRKIEILLQNELDAIKGRGVSNGAVVVIENSSGEILSLVGSRDFFDEVHDGQVNGALALRQPGSTLKAFTYALALENGLTAASLLDDSPAEFSQVEGNYRPQNYDRRYHGLISLRAALACSYNVPAVAVLQAIGPDLLYRRLHSLGFLSLKQDPGFYGVGLTLGNGEVSLLELVRAYSALARQGVYLPEKSVLRMLKKDDREAPAPVREAAARVFSAQVAYIITDILADPDARRPSFGYHNPLSFPFPVAAKTGTSKDFRDNWTVGYTPRYTVGVWVGNFEGEPMHNVSGISGSGPIFRDIMLLLHPKEDTAGFPEPEGIVRADICPLSGLKPTASCPGVVAEVFVEGTEPRELCGYHHRGAEAVITADEVGGRTAPSRFEIAFPRAGDIFKLDPILRKEYQRIKLRAAVPRTAGISRVEWWVNGDKVGEAEPPSFSLFWNLRPGSYTIKAKTVRNGSTLESPSIKVVVLS
jgi:penicillin-binding protein 1C